MSSAKDPVCKMGVQTSAAKGKSSYQGEVYYFCSTACRQQFEKNPERFAGKKEEKPPTT